MKIAFLIPSLKKLGPIIVVHDLIEVLKKIDGISVSVYFFDYCESDILNFDVDCIQIKFFKKYDFSEFDVVHSHGIRPDLYTKIHSIKNKLISTQHNIIFDEYIISHSFLKAKVVEKLWKYALLNKNAVVAIGANAEKYYTKLLPLNNIFNIPNGRKIDKKLPEVCVDDLDTIKIFKKDYFCIGTCTRVLKLKGHAQVIRALPQLPNFCFILVGDGGYLDYIKKLAVDLNVADRCLFLGYRTNATKYLDFFDIYIQSSYTESISIALLEAAAAKKAVVCSSIPSNVDVFNSDEVVFFELDNILDLEKALFIALDRKDELEINIYKKYKNEYTTEIMAQKYLDLYKGLYDKF